MTQTINSDWIILHSPSSTEEGVKNEIYFHKDAIGVLESYVGIAPIVDRITQREVRRVPVVGSLIHLKSGLTRLVFESAEEIFSMIQNINHP